MHFADYSAPYEGNFISALKALEAKLKYKDIHMIYVFTKTAKGRNWAKELLNQKTTVYFLEDGFVNNIILFAKIIRKHHIQLIHTHFSLFKFDLMLRIARLLSKKTVYVRHMHMFYKNKANPVLERIKRFVSNADVEITCSEAVYRAMQYAGFQIDNMINVTNAVDFSRLDHYEKMDKQAFGIPNHSKTVLMFGYDYFVKGVDLAVKAVKYLNDKGQSIVLLIVAAHNMDYIRGKIMKDFGDVSEFVKFLPPRNDIASYYKLADIFLSASRSEGFSYALVEAKYCGVLTVTSNIPGPVMTDSEFIFESENYLDLAEKLECALHISEDERNNIIRRQQKFVVEEFNIDRWSDEIIKIYLEVLK